MSVLCQAKVYYLSDNEIADIYLYGGVAWFHPGNEFEIEHYHVAKYVTEPDNLEEMIYSLCDQTVIAVGLSWDDWTSIICGSGYKVFPPKTDDIEVCTDEFELDDDLLM